MYSTKYPNSSLEWQGHLDFGCSLKLLLLEHNVLILFQMVEAIGSGVHESKTEHINPTSLVLSFGFSLRMSVTVGLLLIFNLYCNLEVSLAVAVVDCLLSQLGLYTK